MVSLCYRALHNYISENNLEGLQGFLENRRVLVDDRDDVKYSVTIFLYFILFTLIYFRMELLLYIMLLLKENYNF